VQGVDRQQRAFPAAGIGQQTGVDLGRAVRRAVADGLLLSSGTPPETGTPANSVRDSKPSKKRL